MPKKQLKNKNNNNYEEAKSFKKSNAIEVNGKVLDVLPGDTVTIELSEYDLTQGRITYRK